MLAVHARILLLSAANRRQRDAELAVEVLSRAAGFVIHMHSADLCFCECLAFHGCSKLPLPIRTVIWGSFKLLSLFSWAILCSA